MGTSCLKQQPQALSPSLLGEAHDRGLTTSILNTSTRVA